MAFKMDDISLLKTQKKHQTPLREKASAVMASAHWELHSGLYIPLNP